MRPTVDWQRLPLRQLGHFLLAAVVLVELWWTWGRWTDVLVDYGQQLYVAWQLSEGRLLYRDLVYNYGPVSPYLNALGFRWLGGSLLALVLVNLLVLAALLPWLYRLLRAASSAWAAWVALLVFALVFLAGSYTGIANYNYLTPYENSLSVGLTLGLGALWHTLRFSAGGGRRQAVLAGLLLGLCLLTKPESGLAALAGCFAVLLADAPHYRFGRLAWLLAAAASPVLVAFLALWLAGADPATALEGVIGSWRALFRSATQELAFYRSGLGLDDPAGNLLHMLWAGAGLLLYLSVVAGVAWLVPAGQRWGWALALVLMAIAAQVGLRYVSLDAVGRPLPLVMLAALAVALAAAWRRGDPSRSHSAVIGLSVFAGVLLLKMALNARIYHYGFALAMPASLLAVAISQHQLPGWLASRGSNRNLFRALVVATLAGLCAHLTQVTAVRQAFRNVAIGEAGDRFLGDFRARHMLAALKLLKDKMGPEQTLGVLPEGTMLNYLARRANPGAFLNHTPTMFSLHGEQRILEDLESHPPDWLVITHKDTSEFGPQFYGRDYAQAIRDWIVRNYTEVQVIGKRPLTRSRDFGLLVMRRKGNKP
ncbi:MAG: glycosyltransferase family 39 protein [Gammaproteobacteria bacterium]|nr:glycosyltransferase family 39 protein [Gammaproteobacteria bacterium]